MSKFYRSREFLELRNEWYEKLQELHKTGESDFVDIEAEQGHLSSQNRRTIAFDNRDAISEFYSALTRYIDERQDLAETERKILELYSKGMRTKGDSGIAQTIGVTPRWCFKIIRKHKRLITF